MQYDDTTAEKMKKMASDSMDACQQKIDELNTLGSNARHTSGNNLLGWQTWIGNIAFTLAAIGGAVLLGKDTPSPYVLISLFIFLVTGLWVTLFHKRVYEQSAINGSKEVDEYRPLYDDKKKAAWEFYQEPHDVSKHIVILKHELKIMQKTKKLETKQLEEIKNERVDYRNDLWLAMLVTAVYLLFWPLGSKVFTHLQLGQGYFSLLFWLIWLLFMLVIIREALSSKSDIKASNSSKRLKTESELRHTKEFTEKIEEEISHLESLLTQRES